MKNFLVSVIVIVLLAAVLQMFGPWWLIAVPAFVAGYLFKQKAFAAFSAGFIAIFLLWVSYAIMLSHANNDILAKKVAELLPLQGHVSILLTVTGFVGGLVGGFASLTGRLAASNKN